MRVRWLWGLCVVAGLVCSAGRPALAQQPDAAREVFLQTIGLLAGQGLVEGHADLEGIAVLFEKKLLPRNKALAALATSKRYVDLVLASFSGQLMAKLTGEEKKDLSLLIGFYKVRREAIVALAEYVRTGASASRKTFLQAQSRVEAIVRQIQLSGPTHGAKEASGDVARGKIP